MVRVPAARRRVPPAVRLVRPVVATAPRVRLEKIAAIVAIEAIDRRALRLR